MFLTVHSAIGVVIGQKFSNPFLAFFLGLIGHYFFDLIPHGDTKIDNKYRNPIYIALAGMIDLLIMIIFGGILLLLKINLFQPAIFMAILGSLLPDFLQGLYYIYRTKNFRKLQDFHNFWHGLISQKLEWPFWLGIFWQISIIIISTAIIIK